MNCTSEKPCAYCIAIFNACIHITVYPFDKDTDQCVFCERKFKVDKRKIPPQRPEPKLTSMTKKIKFPKFKRDKPRILKKG